MRYDYQFFEGKFLPIITIQMKNKEEWLIIDAFVDTGASYSLFHADVAELLGLVLENGELSEMITGDGDSMKVYIHKIKVVVANTEFIASIGFSKDIGVGFNIIGRKDIFDRFIVCFHEKGKFLEFTSIE